jgi:2-polyprenyl-6-methoxyphenol hydroxylase-like FAD-dependent oxidoreductase
VDPGRVVIVGGGIGGLTAAVALQAVGWEVVVCERAPELREVAAGISLWPNAVRLLRRFGVGDAVEAAGSVATGSRVRTWYGAPLGPCMVDELAERFGAPLVVLHRAFLQGILRSALDGQVLRLGAECVAVEPAARGAAVHLAAGGVERGRVVVGADGLDSMIRESVGGHEPPRYSGYVSMRGVVPLSLNLAGRLLTGESWGRGSLFGVATLGGNQAYWWASWREPEQPAGGREDDKRALLGRFGAWHDPIPELIDGSLAEAIVRTPLYERPPAGRWADGTVVLVGDAAHPMLPSLGQGACQAIEDAAALASALAAAPDIGAALGEYERRRRPRAELVAQRARRTARLAHLANPAAQTLRDAAVRATGRAGARRRLDRIIGYEESEVAWSWPVAGRGKAGDVADSTDPPTA